MIQNHYDQINFTERKHVFMYFNIAIKLHLMAWSDGGFDEHQICLKYLPLEVTYLEAENRCHREGGALFKLDSQQKYNLFQEFLGTLNI